MTAKEKAEVVREVEALVAERFGIRIEVLEAREKAVDEAFEILEAFMIDNDLNAQLDLLRRRYRG